MPNRGTDVERWALDIAEIASGSGQCLRRQVGAAIVGWDSRIVAVGYNGNAPGGLSCLQGDCPRGLSDVPSGSSYAIGPGACIGTHAEIDALIKATFSNLHDTFMAVTLEPCDACSNIVRATPIGDNIVWPEGSTWRES